ncbi:MAG: YlmH/Sll1252 family protein [Leptotrichiaceae bacterium]|nr:YlmH/Sll1252 family protein [Leptotrichiaceae bacterium]
MKKEIFLKQFPENLEYEVSRLYNFFEMAKEYGIITYTEEFYTPNIWKKLTEKIEGLRVETGGVFENSDRRQISFIPQEIFTEEIQGMNGRIKDSLEFPCRLLKIEINLKFREYTHRDFLGSLTGLNIKRELMGDLILNEGKGYIPVSEKIADYILSELKQIGRTPCIVEEVDVKNTEVIPEYKYDDRFITVPSKRLDSIISAITNLSRAKVIEPIEKGKVLVDYSEEKNKARMLETGSLITIRGFGKYKLFSEHGETKKGKERLLIKKYI